MDSSVSFLRINAMVPCSHDCFAGCCGLKGGVFVNE